MTYIYYRSFLVILYSFPFRYFVVPLGNLKDHKHDSMPFLLYLSQMTPTGETVSEN